MTPYRFDWPVADFARHTREVTAIFAADEGRETHRGANSLTRKVEFSDCVAAVKHYPSDRRRRIHHECEVIRNLPPNVVPLAPRIYSVILDAPVRCIVFEWIDGKTLDGADADTPSKILDYLKRLHSNTIDSHRSKLPGSLLNSGTVVNGAYGINSHLQTLTRFANPWVNEIRRSLADCMASHASSTRVRLALCHTDSNPANFIESKLGIVGIDWDAGGLGDPLFEIAELSTHPALPFDDDASWHDRIMRNYGLFRNDGLADFKYFRRLMALWWWCRMLSHQEAGTRTLTQPDQQRISIMREYLKITSGGKNSH